MFLSLRVQIYEMGHQTMVPGENQAIQDPSRLSGVILALGPDTPRHSRRRDGTRKGKSILSPVQKQGIWVQVPSFIAGNRSETLAQSWREARLGWFHPTLVWEASGTFWLGREQEGLFQAAAEPVKAQCSPLAARNLGVTCPTTPPHHSQGKRLIRRTPKIPTWSPQFRGMS